MYVNQLIHSREVLYSLKQRYGVPIDYYHVFSELVNDNVLTGVSTVNKIKYKVKKGILLPITMARLINQDTPGSEIDVNSTQIIIDKKDLPLHFEHASEDYLIVHDYNHNKRLLKYGGKRYNIQTLDELEDNLFYVVTARFIKGGVRNEIIDLSISETLMFSENDVPDPEIFTGNDQIFPVPLPLGF